MNKYDKSHKNHHKKHLTQIKMIGYNSKESKVVTK